MFTGIVQTTGRVTSFDPAPGGRRLVIDAGDWPGDPQPGESISVSGVCLTLVVEPSPGQGASLAFDVIEETLRRSALSDLFPGDTVNLERSVTPATLMGGHVVQGHVDGVGEILSVTNDPADWRVRIRPPAELLDCIAPKGSIAIDGVSLTVADVDDKSLEIALIPTTLEETTLAALNPGARCNIETDILARTIVHWLKRQSTIDSDH